MTFHVTTTVGARVLEDRAPISDPFVLHTVLIGWWDLLRALLRYPLDGELRVLVDVDADSAIIRNAIAAGRDEVDGGPV